MMLGRIGMSSSEKRIEWMTGFEEIRALKEKWIELETRVTGKTIFSDYDMVMPWYDHYGQAYGSPLLGVAWRGSELAGIAPLILRKRMAARIPFRRVEFAAFNLYQGEFLVEDEAPETIGLFLSSLVERGGFDLISLCGFSPGSEKLDILLRTGRDAGLYPLETRYRGARVDVRDGYERYNQSMGHDFRSKKKRVESLVAKAGVPRIERISPSGEPSDGNGLLARAFSVADKGWRAKKWGLDVEHEHHRFLREVARRYGRKGMLDLCVLSIGGKDASFVMGVVERGVYHEIVTAYDESMREFAPGVFILNELFKLLPSSGVHLFVSQGDYEYKRGWATEFFPQTRLFLFPRTIRGTMIRMNKVVLPALRNRVRQIVRRGEKSHPRSETPSPIDGKEG